MNKFGLSKKLKDWWIDDLSPEATSMLLKYSTLGVELVGIERTSMIAYVNAENKSGNHSLKDYETIYSLSGVNSLVDYIGGKIAVAVNAPIFSISGVDLDGITQYIDSNYNASLDAINYSLGSAHVEIYLKKSNLGVVTNEVYFSAQITNTLLKDSTTTVIRGGINNDNVNNGYGTILKDNTLLGISKIDVNTKNFIEDGTIKATSIIASLNIPNTNFYLGIRTDLTSAYKGIFTTLMIGGYMNNNVEHNTNLTSLLTSLGTIP